MRRFMTVFMIILAVLIAACQPTGDTRDDEAAAQSLLPVITGYTASNVDSIVDAVTAAGAGAALTSGNLPLAAGITRAEAVLQCMQNVGAVDARVYVENQPANVIPEAGAVVVLNQTRLERNLINCLLTTGGEEGLFRQQTVTIEPCTDSGTFRYQGEDFVYLYVGVGERLCGFFAQHFTSIIRDHSQ